MAPAGDGPRVTVAVQLARRRHLFGRTRNTYLLYMTAAAPHTPPNQVEVTVTDARARLPELIDTEIRDGAVVYLTRYGRRVGAVVPAEVAERFELWEDAYWSHRAAEVLQRDEPTVPWEQAVAELEAGDAGTGARA
jgi:antitoxin (DNA-binding transcriptional repressor) of toxin-antitoxin stability system